MSEMELSFDVTRREEHSLGVVRPLDNWALKLFVIAVNGYTTDALSEVTRELQLMVASIEQRLSPEFEYGRFGFVVVHFGRRGTCVSITHFGHWGTTFEVFSSVWYRYAGISGGFALLDDVEPAMCWFEVPRSIREIQLASQLATAGPLRTVRTGYLTTP